MNKKSSTTIQRVRETQQRLGIGLLEAKRIVERENLLADAQSATSIEDLRNVIIRMLQS